MSGWWSNHVKVNNLHIDAETKWPTFLNAFCMKMSSFWFKNNWNLFLMVESKIFRPIRTVNFEEKNQYRWSELERLLRDTSIWCCTIFVNFQGFNTISQNGKFKETTIHYITKQHILWNCASKNVLYWYCMNYVQRNENIRGVTIFFQHCILHNLANALDLWCSKR